MGYEAYCVWEDKEEDGVVRWKRRKRKERDEERVITRMLPKAVLFPIRCRFLIRKHTHRPIERKEK